MWTHVVQITIPITFWIAIRNVFRKAILAHMNTAIVNSIVYARLLYDDAPLCKRDAGLKLGGHSPGNSRSLAVKALCRGHTFA